MVLFTPEQWHNALCDVHVTVFPAKGKGTIWWNGNNLAVGTTYSNYGKKIWTITSAGRPTYEQALELAAAPY